MTDRWLRQPESVGDIAHARFAIRLRSQEREYLQASGVGHGLQQPGEFFRRRSRDRRSKSARTTCRAVGHPTSRRDSRASLASSLRRTGGDRHAFILTYIYMDDKV